MAKYAAKKPLAGLRGIGQLLWVMGYLLATPVASGTPIPIDRAPLDSIVAVVNHTPVTFSEVRKAQSQDPQLSPYQAMWHLIDAELERQVQKARGFSLPEAEITQALNQFAQQHGMNVLQLRHTLEQSGWEWAVWREAMVQQLTRQRFAEQHLAPQLIVSPEEVQAKIAQLQRKQQRNPPASTRYHMLYWHVRVPESADPHLWKIAYDWIQAWSRDLQKQGKRVPQWEDYRRIPAPPAPLHVTGADLGWQTAEQLPSVFVPHVNDLPVKKPSKPLKNAAGWYILWLVNRDLPLRDPHAWASEARHMLFAHKLERAWQEWKHELRHNAHIAIMQPDWKQPPA